MKKTTNKKVKLTTSIAIVLMLTFISSFIALPIVTAHDPPWEITSYAYVVAEPNPVGIDQTVYITMWVDWPLPEASAGQIGIEGFFGIPLNDIRRHDYTLTITKPDGTTDTVEWPIVWDSTSIQFFPYTPTEEGEYVIKFEYAGQVYTWDETEAMQTWTNDVFLPASATTKLTVQQDPLPNPITSYPLPTEYWTRPIEGQNTDWWGITSNWLGPPQIQNEPNGRYQMDGIAPNSPHIMWTKPLGMGGVVGGDTLRTEGQMFYSGENYDTRAQYPVIMYDRLYFELPYGTHEIFGGYICVDLRTGEEIWHEYITGVEADAGAGIVEERIIGTSGNPIFGQIYEYHDGNQHGAVGNGFLWVASGNDWIATDPWSGEASLYLTDVPSGTAALGPNGEILQYQLNSNGKWLACWNTTEALGPGQPAFAWGMTEPPPLSYNASDAYSWNITISGLPPGSWNINRVFYDDLILCTQGNFGERNPSGQKIVSSGGNITAISLKKSNRGAVLWTKHYPVPEGDVFRELASMDPENRVFIFRDAETLNLWGYSLDDGNKLWGPTQQSSSGWDYFAASRYTYAAYGNLYTAGYDGVIECFDITNGNLKWTYGNGGPGNSTFSGLQTPFGNYPTMIGAISDGKLYTICFEHTAQHPLYKGYTVRCVDAYNGKELWQIDSFVTAGGGGGRGVITPGIAIASGYLAYMNGYDMQMYCIGKGPSALTVEAPLTAVPKGTSVTIRGRAVDIAAGTKQDEQAARFPNGVPVVSDEDMGEWMEYVYMQKPKPEDVTGVPVKLAYLSEDGSWSDIGETVSDEYGNFGFEWTPPDEGIYNVKAFFLGSESYWGSAETTHLSVGPAPSQGQQETEEPSAEAPAFPTTEVAIVAAVAVVAVVAIGAYWALKRRK
jgi:hypothetical protein